MNPRRWLAAAAVAAFAVMAAISGVPRPAAHGITVSKADEPVPMAWFATEAIDPAPEVGVIPDTSDPDPPLDALGCAIVPPNPAGGGTAELAGFPCAIVPHDSLRACPVRGPPQCRA